MESMQYIWVSLGLNWIKLTICKLRSQLGFLLGLVSTGQLLLNFFYKSVKILKHFKGILNHVNLDQFKRWNGQFSVTMALLIKYTQIYFILDFGISYPTNYFYIVGVYIGGRNRVCRRRHVGTHL